MLMEGVKSEVEREDFLALEALEKSWARNDRLGACTVIMGVLDGTRLDIAWLGDSQVMVIRDGTPHYTSHVMAHSFNYPFQLGAGSADTPADAQQMRVELEVGDIVVMASDGLWDNVHQEEILTTVAHSKIGQLHTCVGDEFEYEDRGGEPRQRAYAMAVNLAHKAFSYSLDADYDSPFAVEARESSKIPVGPQDYLGGKPDDITVLVSEVQADMGPQGTGSWCHTHYSNICERRGGGLGWEDN